jgi:hypothetical protein
VASYATPVLMQLALATIWELRGERRLVYLVREGLWSVIALACVSQLSATMRQAVDNGLEAAQELSALQAAENDLRARLLARQPTHDRVINSYLFECAGLAETAAQRNGSPPAVAALIRAEAERLRCVPEQGTTTVESLALRLLTARPPEAGTAAWRTVVQGEPARRYTVGGERVAVEWLCEAAASATGDLVVDTAVRDGGLALTVSAGSFRTGSTVPPQVTVGAETDGAVLTGFFRLQAGLP